MVKRSLGRKEETGYEMRTNIFIEIIKHMVYWENFCVMGAHGMLREKGKKKKKKEKRWKG